jgi:plastocyanin
MRGLTKHAGVGDEFDKTSGKKGKTMYRRLVAMVPAFAVFVSSMLSSGTLTADDATGSISGRVSVSGVRSPENVLVYVEKAPGDYPPPKEEAKMDQVKLKFIPAVLPVVKGTTVRFLNSDPILHNVFWPKGKGYTKRNLGTWGKGRAKKVKFDQEGEVVLLCNVHPEMEGHIVVLQNPFFAVVDKE